ncbi:MAG TPA: cyclopropane-fatty-acyl-phospholipid synthase family protein [Acidimicrobiia bacterium]|nr:cyclopropane-fatty-acyl-phospholipid synthase family protein [Acidimicrobiia bacterium]HZI36948.1 cyclopropane-fatty-acyl-phospholipid synthase family protein [Acidimicrobiia bacterium]
MEALEASRRLYELLAAASSEPPPRLRTWTGEEWGPSDASATLVLRHPGAFAALLIPPSDLTAGEAYVFDDIDIEGDIVAALRFAHGLLEAGPVARVRALRLARTLPRMRRGHPGDRPRFGGRAHSVRRDREVVSHHYDTGNDFFALFLDPLMVYSCAHFLDPAEPLEIAQRRKLDLICRKLDLRPGNRFLDVGCGWGALVIHAAAAYGVEATGITVSAEQAEEARKRAARAGVGDRVRILEADYREVEGRYDAIASVGMAEHVGLAKLPTYFRHLRSLLAPGGQLLNHAIYTRSRSTRRRPSFVRTYVFPDGQLHRVDEAIAVASDAGFELRDVEMLRRSYALTLQRWVANLEGNAAAATAMVGEKVYRIWRLYMAGSAVAFDFGHITVGQLLLADPRRPWQLGRSRLLAADDR